MVLRRGRDDRGGGADAPGQNVYQMRQKMLSIGDDFWIENDARPARVQGRREGAAHPRKTLILETPPASELYKIQEQLLTVRDTMTIEDRPGTPSRP